MKRLVYLLILLFAPAAKGAELNPGDFLALSGKAPVGTSEKLEPGAFVPLSANPVRLEQQRFGDGKLYERHPDNVWRLAPGQSAASGVAAPTFRGQFHAGHSCPSCGRSQFVVAGFNGDGTHTHVCASCGSSWRH